MGHYDELYESEASERRQAIRADLEKRYAARVSIPAATYTSEQLRFILLFYGNLDGMISMQKTLKRLAAQS